MKKFLFVFAILLGSGFLILLSFSKATQDNPEKTTIDFSEGEKLFEWNTNKKTFVPLTETGGKTPLDGFYFHQLSPIDGIYHKGGSKNAFTLAKKPGANTITLGTGVYVCNIQTGLEKYEFRTADLTILPRGRGVFVIDTSRPIVSVFSFDTFLDTTLVNGTNRTRMTNFTIFPSLLFAHDPKNTLELREADVLRISIIDSIRYVDMKTTGNATMLFGGKDTEKDEAFLSEVQKDIIAKTKLLGDTHSELIDDDMSNFKKSSFFNSSNSLLVNGSKKEVILKNALMQSAIDFIKNPKKTTLESNIKNTIDDMKELGGNVYPDGLSLLRQYYYIASFSQYSKKDGTTDFSGQEPPFLSLVENLSATNKASKQGEYYRHLSDIFGSYYFLSLDTKGLNNAFEKILQKILDNKVLTKNEFLPFAFFVTQYLSTGPVIPNDDTMLTISHLFQITNDYYGSVKSDDSKLATITSTTFYNYTRIFGKLYSVFLETYIDKTPEGMLLKKEFLDGDTTNLEQGFIETFSKAIKQANKDVDSKKEILYSKGSFQADSRVVDSYTFLKKTLESFNVLISMVENYPKYLNDFHLNDNNRSAQGILIDKKTEMSVEILASYLNSFNNVNISSLSVRNNFQKDGFYDVQGVTIFGSIFSFKLWEEGHIIADISYTDTFGKNHLFPDITIPLDQKKEELGMLMGNATTEELKYKYDFKNFFETTFLKGDSIVVQTPDPIITTATDTGNENPEIRLFVQKELIDKDFKNIKTFLPIEFKNVTATIGSGSYLIDIHDVVKGFNGDQVGYSTVFESKYIFNRHSFSRISLLVQKTDVENQYEFNSLPIEILPARISLVSLPDMLKDIGYYLDTIKKSYNSQQSIIIDLTGKRVLLDNTPIEVQIPTP